MADKARPWFLLLILGMALLALSACTALPPLFLVGETPAQAMPAAPAQPAQVALAPTATPVPPTATPVPPTATPVPPTATVEPATATPTSAPATATPTSAAPTRTPTPAATATARVLAARATATPTRVPPTPTRVPPTPTPVGPAEIVVTEAQVEQLAGTNAVPGLQIQGLNVEFGNGVMTLSFDSLRYGFVSLRNVVVEGHFTVSNGQVTFVADRIQPRNLATNAIPGVINQALGQNLAPYYVESVRIEPDQLVATGQRR